MVESIKERNLEEYEQICFNPGLSLTEIEGYLKGKSYKLPREIVELYQWRNGGCGSFFLCVESGYSDQEFYDLGTGLGIGEEWERDYSPGTHLLALFGFDGTYYWTVLPEEPQEFAPIYGSDEPDFDTDYPTYIGLTEMLEKRIVELLD